MDLPCAALGPTAAPFPAERPTQDRSSRLQQLRAQLAGMAKRAPDGAHSQACDGEPNHLPLTSGWPSLDRLLPRGQFPRGALTEWLVEGGSGQGDGRAEQTLPWGAQGAGLLSLLIAWRISRAQGRPLVILDGTGTIYPPATRVWGLDERRILWVRPSTEADGWWALDQCLRCPEVGAVWARCAALDDRWFRRFQLAAEQGGTVGVLLRPARYRYQPSWAELQFLVRPNARGSGMTTMHRDGISTAPEPRSADPRQGDDRWGVWVERLRCRRGIGEIGLGVAESLPGEDPSSTAVAWVDW